jgi:hypothetical protein
MLTIEGCEVSDESEHKNAIEIQHPTQEKTMILLCGTEKERKVWVDAIRICIESQGMKEETSENGPAYAITGQSNVQGHQLKIVNIMERTENFSQKMGANFRQKLIYELGVDIRKVGKGVLFLFEDCMLVCRRREDRGGIGSKKPLIIEQKLRLRSVDAMTIKEVDVEDARVSGANGVSGFLGATESRNSRSNTNP